MKSAVKIKYFSQYNSSKNPEVLMVSQPVDMASIRAVSHTKLNTKIKNQISKNVYMGESDLFTGQKYSNGKMSTN